MSTHKEESINQLKQLEYKLDWKLINSFWLDIYAQFQHHLGIYLKDQLWYQLDHQLENQLYSKLKEDTE